LTSLFEIPESFHDGILSGVYEKLHSLYPVDQVINGQIIKARDYRAVQYHKVKYEETRRRLKQFFQQN